MSTSAIAAAAGGGKPPRPVPIPRAPLGPFPQPVNYDHVLPFTPPTGPDLYFYRGQFCGLRVKGAPIVPGCNDENPECIMSALLDNYASGVRTAFLTAYVQDGYTHLQRSVFHALHFGSSLQQYIELSKRAQGDYGLFNDHWFLAGDDVCPGSRDRDAAWWKELLSPIIDQLLAAGVMQQACVGWQLDQYNVPGNQLIGIIAYIASSIPKEIPLYTHWASDALAWWKTGGEVWTDPNGLQPPINVHDRFTWWVAMQPYLTGGHHQGDTTIARRDPGLYQAKLRDTLNPFNDGRMGRSRRRGYQENFRLVVFEDTAQDQFDGKCTELEGDGVGYLLTCTKGDNDNGGVIGGYGNGARMPDGSAL